QRRFRLSGRYRCPRSILHLETSALTCSPDHGAAMCELKFWTHGRCDSRPPPAAKRDHSKSLGRAASSLRRPRHALLKWDVVPEVFRGRLLLALGRLLDLRFDREAQIFLAGLPRSADPAADPILGALNVERAAIVALLLIVRVLLVVAKQRAPVRIVVFHFRFSSAQDDRRRRCAEAAGRFVDESFDGGRMRVHLVLPCAASAGSGATVIVSCGTGAYCLMAVSSTTRLSSAMTMALTASSPAFT